MRQYRIIYVESINGKKHLRTQFKATPASAANLLHKVFASLSRNLIGFSMSSDNEWIDYDFEWVNTRKDVLERLGHLTEFHEAFYDSHQG